MMQSFLLLREYQQARQDEFRRAAECRHELPVRRRRLSLPWR